MRGADEKVETVEFIARNNDDSNVSVELKIVTCN